ncbi:CHRD domain-containing protein [Paraliomyxa miuraensis]|uniref:CHRD domain-containing protein n=1 Tax=Paraliomyxa miuraensis TaxID=376150 RepID=UPI0022595F92|nr:CHRD domain-containing protein [Paraliomyxa miuraensis]MCX4240450.1 CHRD domain-containing protein [Paraliomyxa miuraensis]
MHRIPLLPFPLLPLLALVTACRSSGPADHADDSLSVVSSAHAAPPPPSVELNPGAGQELGLQLEAFLSPHQEPGEEADTPKTTPAVFRSTTPSKSRAEREAAGHRGHGMLRFSRDLSRAYVDVKLEGIDVSTINMFHIHCGKPGILGPILVDFALVTDVQENFSSGVFSVEITNADLVRTADHGHGAVAAFTAGCLIPSPSLQGVKPSKVSTVAGMAQIAAEGELYFNLHTTGQTFYGDVRGQILPGD